MIFGAKTARRRQLALFSIDVCLLRRPPPFPVCVHGVAASEEEPTLTNLRPFPGNYKKSVRTGRGPGSGIVSGPFMSQRSLTGLSHSIM